MDTISNRPIIKTDFPVRKKVLLVGRPMISAVLLVMLALVLRIYHLGTESLWIDEGYSIWDARNFDFKLGTQSVRPLYFIVLRLWMHIGDSEFILRLPAVIFGAASVFFTYLLGSRLVGHKAALFASALMAISPLHVNHSQEVRMYTLVTMLVLIAVHQHVLMQQTGRLRNMIGYMGLTVLSISAFPLTALVVVVQNMAMFVDKSKNDLARWVMSQAIILGPGVPLVIQSLKEARNLAPESLAEPSIMEVLAVLGSFCLMTTGAEGAIASYICTAYLLGSTGLVFWAMALKRRHAGPQSWTRLFLVLWLVVPLIATAQLVRFTGAQWLPRYVIYASPAFFLLLGFSVFQVSNLRMRYLIVAALLILPSIKLVRYYQTTWRPQWREAVKYVERHAQDGDVIALYRPGNGPVFSYYYHGAQPWQEIGWPKLQKRRPWTEDRVEGILRDLPANHTRSWLIMSQHDPESEPAFRRFIHSRYDVMASKSYVGIEIVLFKPKGMRDEKDLVGPPGFEPGTSRL